MVRSTRSLLLILFTATPLLAQAGGERTEFTTLVAHWAEYDHPDYLPFLAEARPEVVQLGFYGAHFWSLAHTPHGKGYPAHFPVQGLKEGGDWFAARNKAVHDLNLKVVGHFNVKFLVGDPDSPEGPRGFFKFYRDLWDEKELGPKPVPNALDLLEKSADGTPITNNNYSIGGMKEYWGCLNNPHWRTVLKAWTKRGIERGVDGYMINYFYRHNCLCEHCQHAFRGYLKERFSKEDLQAKFAIADVDAHQFPEIVSWHDPKESTPLRREMLRFSQVANKIAFDDVFVKYGRSLKPGLIVGQWDHLGNFSQVNGDERCLLPAEMWGRDEDYLWYSSGAAAHYSDLPGKFAGDVTLQMRYIRGAFDDKPFTIGKYESSRTRMAIAELAANGGAAMGFYTTFRDPLARREIVRYYQFLHRHDEVFRANRSHAECLLVYPRTAVHAAEMTVLDQFKAAGKRLLDEHVLFDVLPDDQLPPERASKYAHVLRPPYDAVDAVINTPGRSRFEAPWTVRVSASRPKQGNELTLHFVNYDREEPAEKKSAGRGLQDERPIALEGAAADFVLPRGMMPQRVVWATPEQPEEASLPFAVTNGRLQVTLPRFLVYGIVRVIP